MSVKTTMVAVAKYAGTRQAPTGVNASLDMSGRAMKVPVSILMSALRTRIGARTSLISNAKTRTAALNAPAKTGLNQWVKTVETLTSAVRMSSINVTRTVPIPKAGTAARVMYLATHPMQMDSTVTTSTNVTTDVHAMTQRDDASTHREAIRARVQMVMSRLLIWTRA